MVEEQRGWITQRAELVVVVNALRRWNRSVQLAVVTAVKMTKMPEQKSEQLPEIEI